jgi:hypothetical protein
MGNQKHRPADVRVFIANLRSFEVVYLPETGQIVTRVAQAAPPALVGESRGAPRTSSRGPGAKSA